MTAILAHLLETKQIDGAIVIGSSTEPLWKGKSFVARTKEDLLSAMKSKYAICPTNSSLARSAASSGKICIGWVAVSGAWLPESCGARRANRGTHRAFNRTFLPRRDRTRSVSRNLGNVWAIKLKMPSVLFHGSENILVHRIWKLRWLALSVYFGARSGYRPTSIEVINVLYGSIHQNVARPVLTAWLILRTSAWAIHGWRHLKIRQLL